MIVVNYFNQDLAVECSEISRLMDKAEIDIRIKKMYAKKELKTIFYHNNLFFLRIILV